MVFSIQTTAKRSFYLQSCNGCYLFMLFAFKTSDWICINFFIRLNFQLIQFWLLCNFFPKVSNLLSNSHINVSRFQKLIHSLTQTQMNVHIFNTFQNEKAINYQLSEWVSEASKKTKSSVIWQWVIALNSNAINSYVNAAKRCTLIFNNTHFV